MAYRFREGLRLKKWDHVQNSIEEYRKIRENLCADYMGGSKELLQEANDHNCAVFPLGAGGGGAVFLFSHDKECMAQLRDDIQGSFTEIPSRLLSKGHELLNLDNFQIS